MCPSCRFGLLLETPSDAVPTSRDAFVVVDSGLLVQALSKGAEELLAVSEEQAVNQPVQELLVPADAEAQGQSRFAATIADAMVADGIVSAFVRPWNTFGVRMRVRVAPCGPPQAALLLLETAPRALRAV